MILFLSVVMGFVIAIFLMAICNVDFTMASLLKRIYKRLSSESSYRKGYNKAMKEWRDTLELK
jgi:hypothetical protein